MNLSINDYLSSLSDEEVIQAARTGGIGARLDEDPATVRQRILDRWQGVTDEDNVRRGIDAMGGTSFLQKYDTQSRMGVAHDAARTEMLQDAITMPGRKSTILTGNGLDPQRPAPLPASTILTSPLTLNNPLNPRRI